MGKDPLSKGSHGKARRGVRAGEMTLVRLGKIRQVGD